MLQRGRDRCRIYPVQLAKCYAADVVVSVTRKGSPLTSVQLARGPGPTPIHTINVIVSHPSIHPGQFRVSLGSPNIPFDALIISVVD